MFTAPTVAREWTVMRMPKWMFRVGARRSRIAEYPACDHLNVALGYLLEDVEENRRAIEEICYAITKAGGYFYSHIASLLVVNGLGHFVSKENVCD